MKLEMIGKKFGRWEVVQEGTPKLYSGRTHRYWECLCSCGTVTQVKEASLLSSKSESCGCLHREKLITRLTTHGNRKHPLYAVWDAMKGRCLRKNDKSYSNYGGRGLTYSKDWEDFSVFFNWAVLNGYTKGLLLERKDNNSGYTPENCCWGTRVDQNRNTRSNLRITVNGVSIPLVTYCEEHNIPFRKVYYKVHFKNISVEEAVAYYIT